MHSQGKYSLLGKQYWLMNNCGPFEDTSLKYSAAPLKMFKWVLKMILINSILFLCYYLGEIYKLI